MTHPDQGTSGISPLLERERIFFTACNEIEKDLPVIARLGVGVEIQTFAMPQVIENMYEKRLDGILEALTHVRGPIGCHGPFIDTVHYSPDPAVRHNAYQRYQQALDVARRTKAGYVIFHSQFNPLIKTREYRDLYHNYSMGFWPPILDQAAKQGTAIYLENMFEPTPEPLMRLLDDLRAEHLGICLDLAHINLYSNWPTQVWIDMLRPYIRHIHLSDSHGEYDDHLPLGEGILDFARFIGQLRDVPHPLTFALEHDNHHQAQASLAYLGLEQPGEQPGA